MKHFKLAETGERGWFIGSFPEAAVVTDLAEVCYTPEPVGPIRAHYHTRCTETLLIISGSCVIHGKTFRAGDIVVLEPGEINDSVYLEPSMVIGIKTPAGGDDKVYISDKPEMKLPKINSKWIANDRSKFVIISLEAKENKIWINYKKQDTGNQYSCLVEAFMSRFTEVAE